MCIPKKCSVGFFNQQKYLKIHSGSVLGLRTYHVTNTRPECYIPIASSEESVLSAGERSCFKRMLSQQQLRDWCRDLTPHYVDLTESSYFRRCC